MTTVKVILKKDDAALGPSVLPHLYSGFSGVRASKDKPEVFEFPEDVARKFAVKSGMDISENVLLAMRYEMSKRGK